MKIETQPLEDHQVKLSVEIEQDKFEQAKHRAARQIAKRVKIPGFRPGKAPYHIIERQVGTEAILEDALDLLAQEVYPQVIEESGIKPYGPGRLEDVSSTEPLTFEFVVPLAAEVELPEYHDVRIDYDLKPVTDEDVERVLNNLRQQQAVLEPVDRPAQEDDQVQIKIKGERKNPEEGQTKDLVRERSMPIIIEKEPQAEEWPYPGFSQELIGMSEGEEKTLNYTYPEDSVYEALRGQEAEFNLTVENIKARSLPVLDDEFAQAQGEYDDMESLRKDIRERLEENALQEYNEEYDEKVVDAVLADTTVKFPPQMLEEELQSVLQQLEARLAAQGMDIDIYLKTRQMDMDALREELKPTAEGRLKRFLILMEVARKENIQVQPEEVQQEAVQALYRYNAGLPAEEAKKRPSDEVIQSIVSNVTADLMIQHTLEELRSIARGEAEAKAAEETAEAEETATAEEAADEAGDEASENTAEVAKQSVVETPEAEVENPTEPAEEAQSPDTEETQTEES